MRSPGVRSSPSDQLRNPQVGIVPPVELVGLAVAAAAAADNAGLAVSNFSSNRNPLTFLGQRDQLESQSAAKSTRRCGIHRGCHKGDAGGGQCHHDFGSLRFPSCPPASFLCPPAPPFLCSRCAKAGPSVLCIWNNKYMNKCKHCSNSGNKCDDIGNSFTSGCCTNVVQVPEKFWERVRALHADYKEARRLGEDSEEWEEAEASAKGYARDVETYRRQMKSRNPGDSQEQAMKSLEDQLRLSNQIALQQVRSGYLSHWV